MMILYIFIYLIGCVFSYGRTMGCFCEINEKNLPDFPKIKNEKFKMIFFTFISWIGFFGGYSSFLFDKEKYFFKWDKKYLLKIHHDMTITKAERRDERITEILKPITK